MKDKPLQKLVSARIKGESVKKAEHGKDINSFDSFEHMQKGSFDHETNTKGKDTLLTQHTDKWSSLVRNEPQEAS